MSPLTKYCREDGSGFKVALGHAHPEVDGLTTLDRPGHVRRVGEVADDDLGAQGAQGHDAFVFAMHEGADGKVAPSQQLHHPAADAADTPSRARNQNRTPCGHMPPPFARDARRSATRSQASHKVPYSSERTRARSAETSKGFERKRDTLSSAARSPISTAALTSTTGTPGSIRARIARRHARGGGPGMK